MCLDCLDTISLAPYSGHVVPLEAMLVTYHPSDPRQEVGAGRTNLGDGPDLSLGFSASYWPAAAAVSLTVWEIPQMALAFTVWVLHFSHPRRYTENMARHHG